MASNVHSWKFNLCIEFHPPCVQYIIFSGSKRRFKSKVILYSIEVMLCVVQRD